MTTMRCPFLKEQKVALCRAYPIRKMLPVDRLCSEDAVCFNGEFGRCPIFPDRGAGHSGARKVCPYLEVDMVMYCEVSPVKKMIPSSAFRLETPCMTDAFVHCPTYQKMVWGDGERGVSRRLTSVRGVMVEDGLYYHASHTWRRPVDGTVRVGMDDFAQRLLGPIDRVVLPAEGTKVATGRVLVRVRCAERVVRLRSPVSGRVVARNVALSEDPVPVHGDPYGRGWLLEVQPDAADGPLATGMYYGPDAALWMEGEVARLQASLHAPVGVTMGDGGLVTANIRAALPASQWDRIVRHFLEKRRA